jgi:hypothetical protein
MKHSPAQAQLLPGPLQTVLFETEPPFPTPCHGCSKVWATTLLPGGKALCEKCRRKG